MGELGGLGGFGGGMNMDVLFNMFGGFGNIVFFNFDGKWWFLNFVCEVD